MSTRSGTAGSRTSSSSTNSNPHYSRVPGDVPTSVRVLLASTKDLQESLRQWSLRRKSESDINDVFIRVGTNFQITMDAFAYYGIDLNHIDNFIEKLRGVLERCLSEDQTPETFRETMPEVRTVLYTLLKGLQARQGAWQLASGRGSFMSPDQPC